VQATFLDAIQQRDRWDEHRPLAPWLVGILANHVREARRQRRRAPDPQRLPQREVEGPGAAAEAQELADAVHAAVERLPLPYRQVLSLRLVHAFELQQIAHSLGAPLGTVKTRLHRGMALLRRALPAGLASAVAALLTTGRGLTAVREAVLGHANVAVGTTVGGGLLLGVLTLKKALIAAGLAVLATGGWWWLAAPSREAAAPPAASLQAATATALTPTPAVPIDAASSKDSEPALARLGERQPVATTGELEAEVVWQSDETPAVGIDILVVKHSLPRGKPLHEQTDAWGRVHLQGLEPGPYQLRATYVTKPMVARAAVAAGAVANSRLVVDGDLDLRAVVVDREGQPAGGVNVWVLDARHLGADADSATRRLGVTDRDGRLAFRGLPVHSVWARCPAVEPSRPFVLDYEAGRHQVRLALGGTGCVLRGRVVDPNGRAVPHAFVVAAQDDSLPRRGSEDRWAAIRMETDDDGGFVFDELFPGEHPVVALAEGFAPAQARVRVAPTAPTIVELVLRVGATVAGRVTGSDGSAIDGATVQASWTRATLGLEDVWDRLRGKDTKTGPDGTYRLPAITPGSAKVTISWQNGNDPIEADRQLELGDGDQVTWDVVLPEGGTISGRVVDARDEPLAGWRVLAMGTDAMRSRQPMTKTGSDGRFQFRGLPDMVFRVAVMDPDAKGAAQMVWHAAADNVRPPAKDLLLRVTSRPGQPAWISGRIAMSEGTVKAKATLSLYPTGALAAHGGFSVAAENLEPGADTFRIGPLPPGDYDLLCDVEGRGRLAQRGLHLLTGQTLELPPFDFGQQRRLRVILRQPDGRAAAGATVRLTTDADLVQCSEEQPGEYVSMPMSPGAATASARGPGFAPLSFAVVVGADAEPRVEHTVVAATTVEFRIRPKGPPRERWVAAMQVEVHDGSGGEVVRDMIQVDGRDQFAWPLGLPPGDYTIKLRDFSGGAAELSLQVPAATAPQVVEVQLK